jgi:hypothetical protein
MYGGNGTIMLKNKMWRGKRTVKFLRTSKNLMLSVYEAYKMHGTRMKYPTASLDAAWCPPCQGIYPAQSNYFTQEHLHEMHNRIDSEILTKNYKSKYK